MTDTRPNSTTHTGEKAAVDTEGKENESEVINYRCVYCSEEFDYELTARGHVHFSTNTQHAGRSGFSQDNGAIVRTSSDGSTQHLTVTDIHRQTYSEGLPPNLSERELTLARTRIESPSASIEDVVSQVNNALTQAGSQEYTNTEAASTISRIFRTRQPDNENKTHTQTETQQEANSLEQKIKELDKTGRRLAAAVAVIDEVTLEKVVETSGISPEVAKKRLEAKESLYKRINTEPNRFNHLLDTDSVTHPKESEYENRSALQQQIITELAKNTHRQDPLNNKEIREKTGCGDGYVSYIKREFGELIDWRVRTLTPSDLQSEQDDAEAVKNRLNRLTKKKRDIIIELAKESDPYNPDRTLSEIGEMVGASAAYVSTVSREYGELATEVDEVLCGAEMSEESLLKELTEDTSAQVKASKTTQKQTETTEERDEQSSGNTPSQNEETFEREFAIKNVKRVSDELKQLSEQSSEPKKLANLSEQLNDVFITLDKS